MGSSNNPSKIASEMRAYAEKKWKTTEASIEQFSHAAELEMRKEAPGPDTGTLDRSIKAEFISAGNFMGNFFATVRTKVEDNENPITGFSAAFYSIMLEYGHYNIFLRRFVPPMYFMEGGSKQAYLTLQTKLKSIWG